MVADLIAGPIFGEMNYKVISLGDLHRAGDRLGGG